MCEILGTACKGEVERRLRILPAIIVSYASERFGVLEQQKTRKPVKENRRTKGIKKIRTELRALKKQYKAASPEQKPPLEELRSILRERLKKLRRAEGHNKRRKVRARIRAEFFRDPFSFSRKLLGGRKSGTLDCSAEEINRHLKETFEDPNRGALGPNNKIPSPEPPDTAFNQKAPTLKEIKDVVQSARAASSPGPSGVPYLVYKRCPGILRILWKLMKAVRRKGKVPTQWKRAEGVWIPKEEMSSNIDQFRIISLLDTECKIFFGMISRRLTNFLLSNNYIDTSVQKGGVPGMPGCIEHTGVVTQLIKEAKENKEDLSVLWLDLANAYGSMPHELIDEALKRHHVPSEVRLLIADYYNGFFQRVSSGTVTSDWHRIERGIITGCTISAILFSLAMSMLVKASESECRGPKSKSGVRQPPIRAYMDDLTITTKSATGSRWILGGLNKNMEWARMRFKPGKSRSVVIKKGKIKDDVRFCVGGLAIPSLTEKPVKSLGKIFNCTLKDTSAIKEATEELNAWLGKIDKTALPGRFKAWIYQHAVLPRILWPLLIYDVAISSVDAMERKISGFLRRWLGLPKSLSSAALYGKSNAIRLPFSGLVEEFKVTKTRETLMFRESKDPKVAAAGIEVRTGRRWDAEKELRSAEERLRHKQILGTVAIGHTGLGYIKTPQRKVSRRQLIQGEVRANIEESRICKMVGLSQQGAWTRWESIQQRKVTWTEFWKSNFNRIRFLIQAVYDVLPSPANLHIWGKVDTPKCQLCSERGSLQHILSGCSKALGDGRYRWRHDQVLKAIADVVSAGVEKSKFLPKEKYVKFVKPGEKAPTRTKRSIGHLTTAPDWQVLADLGTRLKFPENITVTNLRPDIVLFSSKTRQVIMIELSVCWESNMDSAYEYKRSKYQELVDDCHRNKWKAACMPIEIGCRGFMGRSLCNTFSKLGISGRLRKNAISKISEQAEKASRWIYLMRNSNWSR